MEGKYRLEKRLGQGGMGVVYSAKHTYLKTQLAIKVILPDLVGNDPQLVTRFRQEALAAAAIRHHNVVQVTDYGVANETMPFLVMEYVEGESLHDLLAREKRLKPDKAIDLMAAICSGVGAAHKQGIVHRDLKPLNVMLLTGSHTPAEGVKILDFGLAKIKSGELLGSFIQAQTTGLMGSPYYMAPEQWADEEPDAQADVYSLGVMFYQMIAGDVPFKGSSIPAIMQKHLNNPPPPFSDFKVEVPPAIEEAVRHTLVKDRNLRTASVQAFVDELRHALGSSTQQIHSSGTANLPLSSIQVLTNPPQSRVYVDNVAAGETKLDGYLLLEGLQSGNHNLRISKDGFYDWQNQIVCDGTPQHIVAQLQHSSGSLNPNQTLQAGQPFPNQSFGQTQGMQSGFQHTGQGSQSLYQQTAQGSQTGMQPVGSGQNWNASGQQGFVDTSQQKSKLSPLVLAITGISALLVLIFIGIGGAYMAGLIGSGVTTTTTPKAGNQTPKPAVVANNESIAITGGKYSMGRNDGPPAEQPAHDVQVKDFMMDKTEVTNAEYHEFVKDTGYKTPSYWTGGKPATGEEMLPVVRVALEDVKAFAEWRSKRDKVTYRLPTEEEWEYAARNGDANNLYPWGNVWEEGRAAFKQTSLREVGSFANGKNKWGVEDLIGNAWEWTSSEIKEYPNSKFVLKKGKNPEFVIRGGGFRSEPDGEKAIFTTSRLPVEATREDGFLGFRLVREK